ncbi:hypothetical protein BBCT_1661 [Bifidobacterium catenulatum DSM 16992 = JCM 1194 = LMG 11043]|uniref:Uncharacterized protein n=1 Tax=Bifidobacterium catenulatum DSM 16992 = JCM 1194 = LMG 11043 TaxID=566552 RepID=A0ABN5V624_9BIFI|nr:hypothetical protein BBCT_1661 [Bifidobacterium catenulatum DSM 16992 = JCM 1194 = LMG 11043]
MPRLAAYNFDKATIQSVNLFLWFSEGSLRRATFHDTYNAKTVNACRESRCLPPLAKED